MKILGRPSQTFFLHILRKKDKVFECGGVGTIHQDQNQPNGLASNNFDL